LIKSINKMENTNEINIQFLEFKIPNEQLGILVENETFHEFKHKIQIDNSDYVTLTVYYSDLQQLVKLSKLLKNKLLCQ
jgi:hypothetical protein